MPAPVSVVELKQRLQDKIALLAAKRMGHSAPQSGSGKGETQKPKSRQEILEKRRAKKEDRKKKAKKAANGPAKVFYSTVLWCMVITKHETGRCSTQPRTRHTHTQEGKS
jgi:hypothetical protein